MAKTVTIYGIKTCDTMKKARTWLEAHGVDHAFHDYRAMGLERAILEGWIEKVGWEKLLNQASTTFRELPERSKARLNENKAISLMLAEPTMIKRPVLDVGGALLVGFKAEDYGAIFG